MLIPWRLVSCAGWIHIVSVGRRSAACVCRRMWHHSSACIILCVLFTHKKKFHCYTRSMVVSRERDYLHLWHFFHLLEIEISSACIWWLLWWSSLFFSRRKLFGLNSQQWKTQQWAEWNCGNEIWTFFFKFPTLLFIFLLSSQRPPSSHSETHSSPLVILLDQLYMCFVCFSFFL